MLPISASGQKMQSADFSKHSAVSIVTKNSVHTRSHSLLLLHHVITGKSTRVYVSYPPPTNISPLPGRTVHVQLTHTVGTSPTLIQLLLLG